ncbi:putative acyl carrier protein [Mortierella sp. GBAus27b]|nr:hypothetical protein BGX31_000513 [Mortierella sp. GBA43]KAI8354339.1 putative acyl carrier protein [Mortierella sp. GBAus27b]
MFRSLRPAIAIHRNATAGFRRVITSPLLASHQPSLHALNFARAYASNTGLARSDIEKRVLDILAGFSKIDSSKITPQANFNTDLHLDSLDTVEVVMAIEEEFSIEIPDRDADEFKTAAQTIDYISKRDDAH